MVDLETAKGVQDNMTFTVGETVVYPNHGAAVIEDIETRQIKGEARGTGGGGSVGRTVMEGRVPPAGMA